MIAYLKSTTRQWQNQVQTLHISYGSHSLSTRVTYQSAALWALASVTVTMCSSLLPAAAVLLAKPVHACASVPSGHEPLSLIFQKTKLGTATPVKGEMVPSTGSVAKVCPAWASGSSSSAATTPWNQRVGCCCMGCWKALSSCNAEPQHKNTTNLSWPGLNKRQFC